MSNPSGAFGRAKVRRQLSMKSDPRIIGADTPRQKISLSDLPLECCGKCVSWHLEAANQQDEFSFPVSHCRRFPGQVVVIPLPIPEHELAGIRLNPKMGAALAAGQVPTRPTPVPMQIVKAADDWCREFEPRPLPPTLERQSGREM